MGTNTLVTKSDGQTILSSDVNQYKTALNENILPRNSSGVVTDLAGDLGSSTYGWDKVYADEYYIGDPSNQLVLKENVSNQMSFNTGGTERFIIDANGADGAGLKSSSVTTAKIADLNITTDKIANQAVTTGKIATGAVTSTEIANLTITESDLQNNCISNAKLQDSCVQEAEIGTGAVKEAKIGGSAVTTSKIADLAVTPVKQSVNYSKSSSSGVFSTNATSDTNITNLTTTITAVGRSIKFEVLPDFTTNSSRLFCSNTTGGAIAYLTLYRDTTKIDEIEIQTSAANEICNLPNAIFFTDDETSGSETYYIKARAQTASTGIYVYYMRLITTLV